MGTLAKIPGRAQTRPEIHTITLPLLFPLLPVNIYFIGGECPTLIDTGMALDIAWGGLVARLSALGYGVKDIRRVILTHGHIDHVGLIRRLCDEGNPDVFIHEGDAERICSDVERLVGQLEENAARLVKMGLRKRDVDRLLRTYVSIIRRFSVRIDGVRLLSDGTVIEFSGLSLEVVHSPGHTAGSICLFDKESRVLFSGDHVMEGTSTNPLIEMTPEQGMGLAPYLASLERVRGLSPTRILSGHGSPIETPRRHIEAILGYHSGLREKVIGGLAAEWTTPGELTERLFPELSGIFASNVVFEIYCHLTELSRKGRALFEEDEGGYYFQALKLP